MISKWLKKRKAKLSERGLYLQDKELRDSNFKVGEHFKYVVDMKKKQIRIVPSTEETKNKVSKRLLKDGVKPVLDLRDKEALQAFQGADFLEVTILENEVIVRGLKDRKISKTSIYNITDILKSKTVFNVQINKDELASVVGESDFTFSSHENIQSSSNHSEDLPLLLRAISLFSGAGIFDIGMIQNDFEVVCAVEINEEAAETYRYNHGDHIHVADITKFDKRIFEQCHAPVMFAGTPCQGFSNSNRRLSFLENPNNLLVREYIKSIQSNIHCKVFILENVPQLLTAGKGQFLNEIKDELCDFHITHGVLNSKDYGDSQERQRAFLIGSKIGPISLPKPTVDNPRTVQDAFIGLHDELPNQLDISESRKKTIERMKCIPQGGNWKQLPNHLKTKGMLKENSNTQSNIYRRLKWDEPSCTIVNPRKCLLTHPTENRILSVRECSRLFSIPDDFIFLGSLEARQQQIANAVTVRTVNAIAKQIVAAISSFNAMIKRRAFSLV